jgi:tetratricopeptide (TPR) repeat protein
VSDQHSAQTPAANPANDATSAATKAAAAGAPSPLPGLMATGDKAAAGAGATGKPGAAADLEARALRAAEQALAEGQQALATAQAQLRGAAPVPAPSRGRGRELALRLLLAANVVAMVVVAVLPSGGAAKPAPAPPATPPAHESPRTPAERAPTGPRLADPMNRALVLSEARDFAGAIAVLEQYLADTPRMAPGPKLNVLMALAYYSSQLGDFAAAQEYRRRADAIQQSHSLPEDLVAMAKAAIDNGDQTALRSIWARFLLQQRQVPSWLYKHVAEAYLQLGDSYRVQANEAAEVARVRELEATAARLRAQVPVPEGGK